MATLTKRLKFRGGVKNPRALARHIGKQRHGKGSVARMMARKRGAIRG